MIHEALLGKNFGIFIYVLIYLMLGENIFNICNILAIIYIVIYTYLWMCIQNIYWLSCATKSLSDYCFNQLYYLLRGRLEWLGNDLEWYSLEVSFLRTHSGNSLENRFSGYTWKHNEQLEKFFSLKVMKFDLVKESLA
jgi:hypothetical protein